MLGSLLLTDIMSDRGPIPLFGIGENFQIHKISNFAIFVKKLVKKASDNSKVRGRNPIKMLFTPLSENLRSCLNPCSNLVSMINL